MVVDAKGTKPPSNDNEAKLNAVVERYTADLYTELSEVWTAWKCEFTLRDLNAVVGALLARQVTLSTELARARTCWNYHVGPLFLRAMADVHISVAWILEDPDQRVDRCRKYIDFGLGQHKLELERRRATIEEQDRDTTEDEIVSIESGEQWLNSQRAIFLTEVNVGSWSGLSVRKMAQEAGCIDFYNQVYTPWSGVAHSMWQHIGRYNAVQCQNPLHGFHFVPAIINAEDHYVLYLTGKYANKTFRLFRSKFGLKAYTHSAFGRLVSGLKELDSTSSGE